MRNVIFPLFVLFAQFASASDPPNVLLLLVDDLKPAIGAYGDEVAITPNIDRLAESGMRFDRAYCNQAVCAPSRFTLMLGAHSTSTGLYGLGSLLREVLPNAVTMPQFFAKHGYRTESLGKVYHIGHGNEGDPESFSVPHFKEKVIEYLDPASKPGGKLTREEAMFTNQKVANFNSLPRGAAYESPDVEDEAYADGRVAAETIKRLKAAGKRAEEGTPFFIVAGFARPHLPFSAPKKYWDLFDPDKLPMPENEDLPADSPTVAHKRGGEIRNYFPVPDKEDPALISDEVKRNLIHGYYASASFVDVQIGKVLDGLEGLGLADDTIVVLWGDHGFHLGDLGVWTKHTNYEQANRIPILIRAPGVTKAGSSTKQPAGSVDIFPTLAELAGLPSPVGPQPIDGVSLVPALIDPAARVRDYTYHAYPKGKLGRAIRTERYRLVEWRPNGAVAGDDGFEYELYDYQEDPNETKNHYADASPELLTRLKDLLAKHPDPVGKSKKKSKKKAKLGGSKSAAAAAGPTDTGTPVIARKSISIVVEAKPSQHSTGVVIAQGGRENGYAVHFIEGKVAFDVRVNGKVTRLEAKASTKGAHRIEASLGPKKMRLIVNGGEEATVPSPGLIQGQPEDGVSVGFDDLSAAGDYEAPNRFDGTVISTRISVGGEAPATAGVMDRATIEAGFESHDRALFVKEGWIRDPYISRSKDGWYYLTGTTPNPGDSREQSDPYNTGLGEESIVGWHAQVFRSKDLIDWKSLDSPYSLKDGVWYESDRAAFSDSDIQQWRLWAPELHWVEEMNRWALVHTSPYPVKKANLSLSASDQVGGPWKNPMGTAIERRHDPSLFKDDDGTWWMVWGATSIAKLKPDFSAFEGETIDIHPAGNTEKMGHEGCLIMKIEGKYVLFGTGWSTHLGRRGSYNLYYATADEVTGPYSERKFAGRFLGHGTPFQDNEGRWWCTAFYNANVPPLSMSGIENRDLSNTAQTINQRGTTLVPMDVRLLESGELMIRAKDPAYATPGPDEVQDFGQN